MLGSLLTTGSTAWLKQQANKSGNNSNPIPSPEAKSPKDKVMYAENTAKDGNGNITEAQAWIILLDLATALCTMYHGSENPEDTRWIHDETDDPENFDIYLQRFTPRPTRAQNIIHFDIKPANSLFISLYIFTVTLTITIVFLEEPQDPHNVCRAKVHDFFPFYYKLLIYF